MSLATSLVAAMVVAMVIPSTSTTTTTTYWPGRWERRLGFPFLGGTLMAGGHSNMWMKNWNLRYDPPSPTLLQGWRPALGGVGRAGEQGGGRGHGQPWVSQAVGARRSPRASGGHIAYVQDIRSANTDKVSFVEGFQDLEDDHDGFQGSPRQGRGGFGPLFQPSGRDTSPYYSKWRLHTKEDVSDDIGNEIFYNDANHEDNSERTTPKYEPLNEIPATFLQKETESSN